VFDAGLKTLGPFVPFRRGHAPAGPLLGTVILSYACNYRCVFCELPDRFVRRRKKGFTEFDTRQWMEILRAFRDLRTAGIGFTGGEPFLRADCADLLEYSLSLGMVTHVNTNAHLLDDAMVDRLAAMGLDSVNVSLDGATADVHDRLRVHRGSFERVTNRIAALAAARDRHGRAGHRRTRIGVTTVLTPDNASQVEAVADLVESLGADSLGFIPMHEYRDGDALDAVAPERPWANEMEAAIETLQRLKQERSIIENSAEYIGLFSRCFEGRPSPLRCHAPDTSLVVDSYGRVFPCVPLSEVDRPVGHVSGGDLVELWKSEDYAAARRSLAHCQACYWNCHTELNLLWQRAPRRGRASGSGRAAL